MAEGGHDLKKSRKKKYMQTNGFWNFFGEAKASLYVYEAAHGFNGQDVLLTFQ